MRVAIIRSCDRDDYSAHVCYLSIKKHNVADKVIFFHEKGDNHPLIKSTKEPIYYHAPCGNFGGLNFVKLMVEELKQLPKPHIHDYVLFCDADIVFLKNPFEVITDEDHGGIYGEAMVCDKIPHVSGQLNIIKGWLWRKYITGGQAQVERLYQYQRDHNSFSGTADDTLFSIYSYLCGAKLKQFEAEDYWIHDKINNAAEYDGFMHKYIR